MILVSNRFLISSSWFPLRYMISVYFAISRSLVITFVWLFFHLLPLLIASISIISPLRISFFVWIALRNLRIFFGLQSVIPRCRSDITTISNPVVSIIGKEFMVIFIYGCEDHNFDHIPETFIFKASICCKDVMVNYFNEVGVNF